MVIKKLIQWLKRLLGFRDNLPSDVLVELNFENRYSTSLHVDNITAEGRKVFTTSVPRYWDFKHKKLVDEPTQWCTAWEANGCPYTVDYVSVS